MEAKPQFVGLSQEVDGTALLATPGEFAARASNRRSFGWRIFHSPYRLTICTIAALLLVVAIAAPLIAPYDPLDIDSTARLQSPSLQHWFGTDEIGRDILSRLLYGARLSLTVAIISILFAVVIGAALGAVAGYAGGIVDEVVMRITDIFLAVPLLVLAMAIAAALGPSLSHVLIAIVLVWWPGYTRQIRAQVLTIKHLPYAEAARSLGVSATRLMWRHILPNSIDPVIARVTIDVGYVVLVTASLSFIGLGSPPPTPDWGTMMADARTYTLSNWTYPTLIGITISGVVLVLALVGDAIREAMEVGEFDL